MNLKKESVASSWRFENDHIHPFAWAQKLFNEEECKQIIKKGETLFTYKATISPKKGFLNTKIRDSEVSWIFPENDTSWIFQKIVPCIKHLNKEFFKFDITGLYEGLQFTKYTAPSGKYRKHTDRGYGSGIRKLSFTIQLTSEEDYKGGDLCLYEGSKPMKLNKEAKTIGTLIAFPSFCLHEVKEIKKGKRFSLVGWIGGPNFK